MDKPVKLSKQEAQEYLKVYLEEEARWKLGYRFYRPISDVKESSSIPSATDTPAAPAVKKPTPKDIAAIADELYKGIVRSWRYDTFMLLVCRAVKCSPEYILNIVKDVNTALAAEPIGKSMIDNLIKMDSLAKSLGMDVAGLIKSNIPYRKVAAIGMDNPGHVYMLYKSLQSAMAPDSVIVKSDHNHTKEHLVRGSRELSKCEAGLHLKEKKKKKHGKK